MTSDRAGWTGRITDTLIRHAAGRAPGALAERLQEEWLADLAEQRGGMTRAYFAMGCCWTIMVIAREHAMLAPVPAPLPAAGSFPAREPGARRPPEELGFLTGAASTLVLLAVLHAGLVCGVAICLEGL